MTTPEPDRRKRIVLVVALAVNLILLTVLGVSMFARLENVRAQEQTGLSWGDPAPQLDDLRAVDGRAVSTRPVATGGTAFFIFFDTSTVEALEPQLDVLARTHLDDPHLELTAVFQGDEAAWRDLDRAVPERFPVVADAGGEVARAFAIAAAEAGSFSVAVDDAGLIRLFLGTILPAHLIAEVAGRSSPPNVGAAGGARRAAPSPIAAGAGVRPGMVDAAAPTGRLETGQVRVRLRRVSDRGAGRLEVGSDGTIYALDRRQHAIWMLTPDGADLRRLGGFGQGPGDLIMPYDMGVEADGSLLVVERGNQRLQRLGPEGGTRAELSVAGNVSAVTVAGDGTILVAASRSGHRVLRTERDLRSLRPHVALAEVPWLRGRLETDLAEGIEVAPLHDRLAMALNESYVRIGRSGRLFLIRVWKPALEVFDARGRRLFGRDLTFSGLDRWSQRFDDTLSQLLAEGTAGVLILVQDFALAPDDETVALALTGDCPGVVLATPDGTVHHELCLLDDRGLPFEPTAICGLGGGRWLVGNGLGIFTFEQ